MTASKHCAKCKLEKALSEFGVSKQRKDGLKGECLECRRAEHKAWRERYPEKAKAIYKNWYDKTGKDRYCQRKYGISYTQKEKMYANQQNKCAACEDNIPSIEDAHVDHNHATSKVRELLCHNCNVAEGLLSGDSNKAYKLAFYMRKHGEAA